jgi:HEPN domain-containing protein
LDDDDLGDEDKGRFRQGEKDLQHAKRSVEREDFQLACFAAQQAAEKPVKSPYQSTHIDAIGHTISKMLQDLPYTVNSSRKI